MEVGEKIRKLRSEHGLTQEQLAEKINVSRTAVSKWESGRGWPGIDSLKNLSSLFGVTIDELVSTDE
ncbi:MAG: helix-turn-helix transcriptional regulator, partial [Bullifex sp.]